MGYFDNAKNLKEKAVTHTKEMSEQFPELIDVSVQGSLYYGPHSFDGKYQHISVEDLTSDAAVHKYAAAYEGKKIAVLNFASYKNPGGMFIEGSSAQEECLCHASTLYNVISDKRFAKFYERNKNNLNRALYTNQAIYSPDIVFTSKDDTCIADVITCAAPNKAAAQMYQKVTDEENHKELDSRIKFVLDIANDRHVNVLILGAYGCGVFGQDPVEVAMIFNSYLASQQYRFDLVVFAIPNKDSNNFKAFHEVFKKNNM